MTELENKNPEKLTEAEKKRDAYLKREINLTINTASSLNKEKMMSAYNLRNGIRDIAKFEYLWKAYGIEFPSQMRHVPVMKSIFESLSGKQSLRPFKPKVTCVDSESLNYILEKKKNGILADIEERLFSRMQEPAAKQMPLEEYLLTLKNKYQRKFQTNLEISAQDVLNFIISKGKLKDIFDEMFEDLFTSGSEFYQNKVIRPGRLPQFRALNPMTLYYTKPEGVKFIKDCPRVMIKEKWPVTDVWTEFGHKMSQADADKFSEKYKQYIDSEIELVGTELGFINTESNDHRQKGLMIPEVDVHYVEFKANTKVEVDSMEDDVVEGETADKVSKRKKQFKYKLDLFSGYRIMSDIFVDMGMVKHVVRDPDNPSQVSLSVNGICFQDKNGEPYSLVLSTEHISDKIDILHYHAETLLSLSGSKAVLLNFPDIPAWMGTDPSDRIMKWMGYLKSGVAVVDTSQESAGAGGFNNYTDLDLSLSNSIKIIFEMIETLEHTGYKITGVNRQSIGDVSQSDGKGTSEIAIQGSEIVTQPLFRTHDQLVECALTDVLNSARLSYPDGVKGIYPTDDGSMRIFTSDPKFPIAYYNVFIDNTGETERKIDELKLITGEMIKSQMVDPKLAFDISLMNSLSAIKSKIDESFSMKENNEKKELQEAVAQYEQQLKEMQKQLEQTINANAEMDKAKLEIENKKVDSDVQLKTKELELKEKEMTAKDERDRQRITLEAAELAYPSGGNSSEVRNK